MNKIFSIILIICFSYTSVFAITEQEINDIKKKYGQGEVFVFYGMKPVGVWNKAQFEALIKGAEFESKITKAEKEGKVQVNLKDDPWKVKLGSVYESKMTITWKDEDGVVLKTVTVDIKLQTTSDGKIFAIYKDVAAIAAPVLLIIVFVLVFILVIK